MKNLYRFFIYINLSTSIFLLFAEASSGSNHKPAGHDIPKESCILISSPLYSKEDSLKFHNTKLKDVRSFKSVLILVSPKSKFYNNYLLSTIAYPTKKTVKSFIKLDTTIYPVSNNLFNMAVSTPVHDEMTLSYSLIHGNFVTAKLFSVLGNEITTLFAERQNSGSQLKTLYVADKVSSGIYILRITIGSQRVARRIQIL